MHNSSMHGPQMHMRSGSSMGKASFEVALKGKKPIAEGTMAFVFEKPEGFTFMAGQHVRMTLINPLETDSEGDSRFFSLASTPQDTDLVFAMRMRATAFKRVLGRMPIGETVRIQILLDVPHGAFALHDDPSKPAVFLVGGIGIVPVFSMIKDAIEKKLPHKLVLFYANRRPEDAPFLAELQDLAKENPNFTLVTTMTEPENSAKSWRGETGRIDQAMLTKYVGDIKSPMYYIAGLPAMASAMKALLADLGVKKSNIQAEEFSGFDLNQLNSTDKPTWKKHLVLAVIVLVLIVGISFHAQAVTSIAHASLGGIVGLVLILIAFKVFMVLKFKHVFGLIHGRKQIR